MNRKFIITALIIIVLIAGVIFLQRSLSQVGKVHFHAGIEVYKDGLLQNFSDFKYMHEKPCTLNGKPLPGVRTDEQLEKAHLHDQTGDVLHIHRTGAKWKDLFINIKYPIDKKNVSGYINGERVSDFLEEEIDPYDSLVVFVGKHKMDQKYLKNAVTKERIKQVEKKSETCSS